MMTIGKRAVLIENNERQGHFKGYLDILYMEISLPSNDGLIVDECMFIGQTSRGPKSGSESGCKARATFTHNEKLIMTIL